MKATAFLALSSFVGAAAFLPAATHPRIARGRAIKMNLAELELEAGKSAPFTDGFDPLGLSNGKSFKELKKLREAELKHGRVAMLAVLGAAVQENFHPLFGFNGKEMDGAVFHFQEIQNVQPSFWTLLIFIIGLIESRGISNLWDEPDSSRTDIAGIREDVICGDYGLDPLNLRQDEEKFLEYRTKELNNGRLAMIAAAGIAVQERFVTGGLPEFEVSRLGGN